MRERLYRSRDDRMLFGVAGGMAEWLGLDPSIVRLVWALLIIGGVGVLLYIVAAIVIPEAPYGMAAAAGATPGSPAEAGGAAASQPHLEARRAARRQGSGNAGVVIGLLLVVVGTWFLIRHYLPAFDTSWFVPGVLIVIGIALVAGAMGRSRNAGG